MNRLRLFNLLVSLPLMLLQVDSALTLTTDPQLTCSEVASKGLLTEKNQRFNEVVRRIRGRSLRKTRFTNLTINGTVYGIQGILGRGSSIAYLATTPDGRQVVIKHISESDEVPAEWINSIYYEIAVTKYYLSQGLRVPKIVDSQIFKKRGAPTEGYLVKEYHEGITREEFLEGRGLNFLRGNTHEILNRNFFRDMNRTSEIHKGFRQWLKTEKIDLHAHPFSRLESLIQYGDHSGLGYRNWLFEADTYEWMLFDP